MLRSARHKGSLSLSLEIPAAWAAVSNAPEIGRETSGDRATVRFGQTAALPTYVFGFAAGQFSVERGERNGRAFHMYHRETDAGKFAANREAIFDLHQQAIEWLETYTARKYRSRSSISCSCRRFSSAAWSTPARFSTTRPFCCSTNGDTERAPEPREPHRARNGAHVVRRSRHDEVVRRCVAERGVCELHGREDRQPAFPDINHELRFLLQHYPSAYDVDRTAGTNPIRQTLDNLKHAGSLYGANHLSEGAYRYAAPREMLGPDAFRDGLREYLTRFAFGNATWTDLIGILDARTGEDLAAWSRAWVEQAGRPTIATDLVTANGKMSRLSFYAIGPAGSIAPLEPAAPGGSRVRAWRSNHGRENGAGRRWKYPKVGDLPPPHYILPNGEGTGYGSSCPTIEAGILSNSSAARSAMA